MNPISTEIYATFANIYVFKKSIHLYKKGLKPRKELNQNANVIWVIDYVTFKDNLKSFEI